MPRQTLAGDDPKIKRGVAAFLRDHDAGPAAAVEVSGYILLCTGGRQRRGTLVPEARRLEARAGAAQQPEGRAAVPWRNYHQVIATCALEVTKQEPHAVEAERVACAGRG